MVKRLNNYEKVKNSDSGCPKAYFKDYRLKNQTKLYWIAEGFHRQYDKSDKLSRTSQLER